MSIFDKEDIITRKYLEDKGFAVFDNYAILWIKLGVGYLSRNIIYWFENKEVILSGGCDKRRAGDIFTISDLEFEILADIEYLKNKYKTNVSILEDL